MTGNEARSFEFASRCRVIRKLADGGMGSIYLAEQIGESGFAKTVALKVIRRDRLSDESSVRQFVDEARLVADLVHQNIVQFHNLASYKGVYFVVMEFIHGITATQFLQRHVRENRLPPVDLAAFVVSRVCRALSYAHDKRDRRGRPLGIVHRDVTPTNIMLDFRGFVKLADFGIAKALTANSLDERRFIVGKFPYMPPEQARAEATDGRSDVFALAAVLYELLTGRRPYEALNREQLLGLFKKGLPGAPAALRPTVAAELSDIVMRGLALEPAERFQTAGEFGRKLELYMYSSRYGPTDEKLAEYLHALYPDVDRDKVE